MPAPLVPLTYMVYNLVYVLISLPAGILSDRLGRPTLIFSGYLAYALTYLGFGLATQAWHAWILFAAYGLFSGLTEGVQRAWIGELTPERLRGSAFGAFHFLVGIAALPASLLMGLIWERQGPSVAFYVDSGLALAATVLFAINWRFRKERTTHAS